MKKTIRNGVFETNSSSCHSISIQGNEDRYFVCTSQFIYGYLDGYGWGYEELTTPQEKLSYVLTYISEYEEVIDSVEFQWLKEMIRDYCGSELVMEESDNSSYIDHQSLGILNSDVYVGRGYDEETYTWNDGIKIRDSFWSKDEYTFKENMKELIFNSKYVIIIDSDN